MHVTNIYPYINYKYITTNSEAYLEISKLKQDLNVPEVGIDTETTGLDPHTSRIRLVQLWAKGWEYGLIIDCFPCTKAFGILQELIDARKDIIWVGHNLKFELKMFWSNGVELYGCKLYDTYLVSTILDCGLGEPQDLGAVFDRYVGDYLDKGEQKSDWGKEKLDRQQLDYAITDSWAVIKLKPFLTQELIKEDLVDTFKLETKVLPGLAAMEWWGIRVDTEKLEELRPFYEDRLGKAEQRVLSYVENRYELLDLFGNVIDPGFSVSSSSQVLELLHKLEIPNPLKEEKGYEQYDLIPGTGKAMTALLDWSDYPILEDLDRHRKASKLLSSYIYNLPNLINPVTEKLHTYFRPMVSTGRMQSSTPNLNQLPRPQKGVPNVRECFIPDDGYDLVIFDYSQIEIRVVADVCVAANPDKTKRFPMLQEFLENKDPYSSTGAIINNISYDQMMAWKKEGNPRFKDIRQKAKPVRLGFQFAMGAKKFKLYAKQSYGQTFTQDEADTYRQTFFKEYYELEEYHNQFKDKSIRQVTTFDSYRRKRKFKDYPGVSALCNFPIQGGAGNIQKTAIYMLFDLWFKQGYSPLQSHKKQLLLTVHDELNAQAVKELSEEATIEMEQCMINAGQMQLKYCPVSAEGKVARTLADKD